MTFTDLFIKEEFKKGKVDLILNKDFKESLKEDFKEYFEEDFDGDDGLFNLKIKTKSADKFFNYLSEKYSSVDEFFQHYESSDLYLHEALYSEFGFFAKGFLRKEMILLDYYKKYKFDTNKTDNHAYYAIDFGLILNNSFHGSIYIDDCSEIDVIEKDGEKWARVTAYKNDLRFNLNDDYLLGKVKIFFVEML